MYILAYSRAGPNGEDSGRYSRGIKWDYNQWDYNYQTHHFYYDICSIFWTNLSMLWLVEGVCENNSKKILHSTFTQIQDIVLFTG